MMIRKIYQNHQRALKIPNNINQHYHCSENHNHSSEYQQIDNNLSKLLDDLEISDYNKPIIDQEIDSLTLTELIIQVEDNFSIGLTMSDIIDKRLTCNDISNLISPNVKTNTTKISLVKNHVTVPKKSYDNNKLKNILVDLGIENLDYSKPLINNNVDSLTLTEFIIQLEDVFGKSVSISEIIEKQMSINDIFGSNQIVRPVKPKKVNQKPKKSSKGDKSHPKFKDNEFNFYNYTQVKNPNYKIKTTHVGSLPKIKNNNILNLIEKQLEIGIDYVNDGEVTRQSYVSEILNSLTGFEENKCIGPIPRDIKECSSCSRRFISKASLITLNPNLKTNNPACTGPISYKNLLNLQYIINNYLTSLEINGVKPENSFYTVPSPGTISIFFENQYYESNEKYLSELSNALKKEYEEITRNGINLQIDCPDLAMGRHTRYSHLSEREFIEVLKTHVFYLNKAIENIDPKKL